MDYKEFKKQAEQYNPYSADMDSEQKWQTFMSDARSAVKSQISTPGIIKDWALDTAGRAMGHTMRPWNWHNPIKMLSIPFNDSADPNTRVNKRIAEATLSEPVRQAADRFIMNSTPADMSYYMQAHGDVSPSSGANAPYAAAVASYTIDNMKKSLWPKIWANPIRNIPIATSMWLRTKGLNGPANFAENPVAFYGSLVAALAAGGSLISGNDDEDDEEQQYDKRYYMKPFMK